LTDAVALGAAVVVVPAGVMTETLTPGLAGGFGAQPGLPLTDTVVQLPLPTPTLAATVVTPRLAPAPT
jgi:hypothetical protein